MKSAFLKMFVQIFSIVLLSCVSLVSNADTSAIQPGSIQAKLAELEVSSGGRLGVSAVDLNTDIAIQYRAEEVFPMGCTSKVIGVAAILKQSMTDPKFLQQHVNYSQKDIVSLSPITEKHTADGMDVSQLSEAAIIISDNSAMNLLVKNFLGKQPGQGNPQDLNIFARSIGNKTFNLVNWWPKEATTSPASLADTATPIDMEKSMEKLVLGDVLAPLQRSLLQTWLKNNKTGDTRIRAGVPKTWVVGDKTGTGANYGTTNDVAVIWPPQCKPIVVAIYFTQNNKAAAPKDEMLVSTTRMLLNEFAKSNQCLRV